MHIEAIAHLQHPRGGYRSFYVCIRWVTSCPVTVFIAVSVSCRKCRSCTSSVMSPSLLSPTKALHVTWIHLKNLSCPRNSSSYKTRQYTHSYTRHYLEMQVLRQLYSYLILGECKHILERVHDIVCVFIFFPPNSFNRISKMIKSICQQRWDSYSSLER